MAEEDTNAIESQQEQYVVAFYAQEPQDFPPRWTWDSCVEFAKWYTGHSGETWGWAGNIEPTSDIPYPGGFVLTREGGGHIAVITSVASQSIEIIEANYIPGQVGTRSLSLDDELIKGFK